jgi:oxaloacetate decarboxylase beta subunit
MVFFDNMGLLALTPGMVFMWLIGLALIYLAITRQYEPLLLLPIGFGIIITNLPLSYLMEPGEGLIWRFYHYGIEWEIIPPLIFWGWVH